MKKKNRVHTLCGPAVVFAVMFLWEVIPVPAAASVLECCATARLVVVAPACPELSAGADIQLIETEVCRQRQRCILW